MMHTWFCTPSSLCRSCNVRSFCYHVSSPFMYKNAVLDDFERANIQIKHQNRIQWLIKTISGHRNFTSGLNMSLPVHKNHFRCLLSHFKDHLSISEVNLGHFRCHKRHFRTIYQQKCGFRRFWARKCPNKASKPHSMTYKCHFRS